MSICNSATNAILFIRKLEREDSGKYKLEAQQDTAKDELVIDVQVVGTHMDLHQLSLYISDLGSIMSLCVLRYSPSPVMDSHPVTNT